MATAVRKQAYRISLEDYLAGENDGTRRHEFVNGEVFAMAGATVRHNKIVSNIQGSLYGMLTPPCFVYSNDLKVGYSDDDDDIYYYPDVFVSCAPVDDTQHIVTAPALIIEVLSRSTERNDRFEKRAIYQKIPSAIELLLVAQDFPQVELYRRRSGWAKEFYRGSDVIVLDSISHMLSLNQIYRSIDFTKPEA